MATHPPAHAFGQPGSQILIMEDEYFIADDLRRALMAAGADVVGPFDDPTEALKLVQSGGCELQGAVLDINLHGTMIFPLANELRARNVPFVFATGYDAGAIPPEFDDVPRWEKPFDAAALARALILPASRH
jgi:DNA-binding LytR/AlgR family response regulator